MGIYLNFPDISKDEWLEKNAVQISYEDAAKHEDYKDIFLIVLMHNGLFSAAGIAYKQAEKTEFLAPGDSRPKKFFLLEKEKMPEYVIKQLSSWGVI